MKKQVLQLCKAAKSNASKLAQASNEQKNQALRLMAEEIISNVDIIKQANKIDMLNGEKKGLSVAMLDRLLLNDERIKAMAAGIVAISELSNPVGKILDAWQQPSGLSIKRVTVPIGVVAVIYESRPNVTADAAALCLKSGNAVILRSGSESVNSSKAIVDLLHKGLLKAGLPIELIQIVPNQSRDLVDLLITKDEYIDVLIPRGGKSLIASLSEKSKIPLFKHLDGVCHTYIHEKACPKKAVRIALNAKMRRTGICGATETILIDKKIINSHLISLVKVLKDVKCEVRVDKQIYALFPDLILATEEDWQTEYLDKIVSIKSVADISEAISHIAEYGSGHTDAIITEDNEAAAHFLNDVDSAIVMHNTSTQFADGGEFGMGAEIGISTGKLHARGPVGVQQLTTFKYQVTSDEAVRP